MLYQNYPNELERPLILSLIQNLWDRGEANGYAHHMTGDPLPNTPPHEVLLHEAFGDHQVANVATEVEARTIGAALRTPALDPGRHSDVNPFYGIPPIGATRIDGSALVVWDSRLSRRRRRTTLRRAPGATRTAIRATRAIARAQKSEFLKIGGGVVDTCGAGPCYANGYTGPMRRCSPRWAIAARDSSSPPPPWRPRAGASHQPAELVSTGPAGGNGPLTAAYAGSSTDGERVFFETLERLVAADTDNRNDVYESASGVTLAGLHRADGRERRRGRVLLRRVRPTARACSSGRPSG